MSAVSEISTKVTAKRAEFVRNNLDLPDWKLRSETGLSMRIISDIREVQEDENLQRQRDHYAKDSEIYTDPNKISMNQLVRELDISRPTIQKDLEELDFIEKKKIRNRIWITPEEFERYKEYREEVKDEN